MSSTNPLYAFWDYQLKLLGDRDPVEVLAATPGRLRALVEERDADWRVRRIPEKWSPLEILTHLRDMEIVFGFRLRTILYDDRPRLMGIDQDLWNAPGPTVEEAASVADDFAAMRRVNVKVWRSVTGPLLERAGVHDEAGAEISLDFLRRVQAGHDLSHLAQIKERLG